jgi:hypothetical protein
LERLDGENMLIEDAGIPILVNRVENHAEIKPILLDLIDKMPNIEVTSSTTEHDKISKSDYDVPKEVCREYWKVIEPIAYNVVCKSLFEKFKYQEVEIDNYWFQQYNQSDTHGWHVHGRCHWINVYFIELPNESVKTQILDYRREGLIDYQAKEGDIITFPSMLYHRSPPNPCRDRKTIVSFNLSAIK